MARYEVTRAWHGVKVGDVVELKQLHPSLKSNVRPLSGQAAELVVALAPAGDAGTRARRSIIAARLTELGIAFRGNLGETKLAELLPEGELEKLFPAE